MGCLHEHSLTEKIVRAANHSKMPGCFGEMAGKKKRRQVSIWAVESYKAM